jgi:mannitol-1-/sugar-/sorbitol-6-phosphatase
MLLQEIQLGASCLLFDMDGTLLNSHAPTVRAYTDWANRYGLDPEHVLREAQGRRTIDSLRALAPRGANVESDAAEVMLREREDTEGIVEISGAGALLRSLPADRWAIVTSADGVLARNRIKAAGLPIPNVLITAEDVEVGKPCPDGYLLAASKLNASPSECIVFEDAPAGIVAGRAAGARVIAIESPMMRGKLDELDYLTDLTNVAVSVHERRLVVNIS